MANGNKSSTTIRRRTQRKVVKTPHSTISTHCNQKGESWSFLEKFTSFCYSSASEDVEPEISKEKLFGPSSIQKIMSSEKTLFMGLIVVRLINAMMIQTSFVPDEYWQSLEVAHRSAFGYGYLTWEWRVGLRGYSYPLIFTFIYKLLAIFKIDNRLLLIKLPKILQALFAGVGDLYLYRFSRRISNQATAQWSLFCQLTSWFTFYCCTRTLTNSTEATMMPIALYYFPWPDKTRKSQWKFVLLVGIAVMFRPTAAILWLPMCLWHVWLNRRWPAFKTIMKIYTSTGLFLFGLTMLVDKHFYRDWTVVQWNFLKFNFLSDMGTFYGSHPWHWYISQGFNVVIGTHFFPFIFGVRNTKNIVLLYMIAWTVGIYSLLGHKEFRFIYPILPIAMHICGEYLSTLDRKSKTVTASDEKAHNFSIIGGNFNGLIKKVLTGRTAALFLLLTNIPAMLYFGLLHQRGTLDVMKYLANSAAAMPGYRKMDILFLMPCHSTPYYSYLHTNVGMRFLTCEPDLTASAVNYTDEADLFYDSPGQWLNHTFPVNSALPTHLVMYNVLHKKISSFLSRNDYKQCARIFHTHLPEGRVGTHILVYCT
ncbi:GPI alpha-1,2-mannosyltransferase 3-like [Tubulanus polymorphus]|uniref:GPI alpha-1,2-mannosyltransferase 3-like n=1 Tax=Tubulanus polymorphus TaxID=672921 RepID=UPI003DA5DFB1